MIDVEGWPEEFLVQLVEVNDRSFIARDHQFVKHFVRAIFFVLVLGVDLNLREIRVHHLMLVIHLTEVLGPHTVQVVDDFLDLEHAIAPKVLLDHLLVELDHILLDGVLTLNHFLRSSHHPGQLFPLGRVLKH